MVVPPPGVELEELNTAVLIAGGEVAEVRDG
jgi:hypothetical protein